MGAALLVQPGPPLQAAPAGVAEGKDPSCPQQTPQLSPLTPEAPRVAAWGLFGEGKQGWG